MSADSPNVAHPEVPLWIAHVDRLVRTVDPQDQGHQGHLGHLAQGTRRLIVAVQDRLRHARPIIRPSREVARLPSPVGGGLRSVAGLCPTSAPAATATKVRRPRARYRTRRGCGCRPWWMSVPSVVMARVDQRHPGNVAGEWFVDTRCIDCGTCREIAPLLFADVHGSSVVRRQPGAGEQTDAWLAAQACPTMSIGTVSHRHRPGRLYPREVAPGSGVFDLGYCSPDSFGASAWFVARPAGNVLVDSPRFTEALAGPIGEMGGIDHVVLTHRDDVADGQRWATRFGARTWIHADDRDAAPWATDIVTGEREVQPGLARHSGARAHQGVDGLPARRRVVVHR